MQRAAAAEEEGALEEVPAERLEVRPLEAPGWEPGPRPEERRPRAWVPVVITGWGTARAERMLAPTAFQIRPATA